MKKIVWGILCLFTAILIPLNAMGISMGVIGLLPVSKLLLSLVLLAIGICIAIDRNWFLFPFPFGVIFMLLQKEISEYMGRGHEKLISNWLVLLSTVLIPIGLSFISGAFRRKKDGSTATGKKYNGSAFASEMRYIDCTDFSRFMLRVKMGETVVRFENADRYKGDGTLNIHCSMGHVIVYVPNDWSIDATTDNHMGDITLPNDLAGTGPVLHLQCDCNMGSIDVRRVS